MDIYEQLPVLLGIEFEGNLIKMRLDDAGLGSFDLSENSIREIILQGCQFNTELSDKLNELITEVFEYEIFERENRTIFHFWGDYGRFEEEIECVSITENFSQFTEQDLVKKGTALFNLYVDLYKRFATNSSANSHLRERLKFEISNQIERCLRKVQFFAETDKGKSEAFQSEIKFLQKIQKLLNESLEN